MDKVKVCDLDFVYISFNEPNKEENWADLKNKVPWAKRVDGVKGFDSAHKVAAEKAETDFFISVDGDNILDESFFKNRYRIFKLISHSSRKTFAFVAASWSMVTWICSGV